MKRPFITAITGVICCIAASVFTSNASAPPDTPEGRARLKAKEAQLKELRDYTDSTVLSQSYRFIPNALEQLPGSGRFNFSDPTCELIVSEDNILATLPYLAGVVEPYEPVMMEITGPVSDDYRAELKDDKWEIAFSSSDVGPVKYRFILTVSRDGGMSQLEVKSSDYPTVIYYGHFTAR